MPKTILMFLLLFSFVLGNAQHKTKFKAKHNKATNKTVDSCFLLQKLLKKNWSLTSTNLVYTDSIDLFRNNNFRNCLKGKSKQELIKLLGAANSERIYWIDSSHYVDYEVYSIRSGFINVYQFKLDKNNKINEISNLGEPGEAYKYLY